MDKIQRTEDGLPRLHLAFFIELDEVEQPRYAGRLVRGLGHSQFLPRYTYVADGAAIPPATISDGDIVGRKWRLFDSESTWRRFFSQIVK